VLAARCQSEGRALVPLDLDFSNIRAYPPAETPESSFFALGTKASIPFWLLCAGLPWSW
jgi:hypothetical protein